MAEQKTRVLRRPPVPSGYAKHGGECRAWVRFLSDQTVAASATDTAATGWSGQVRDISRSGVALIVWRQVERGTNLILDLATNAGELRRLPVQVLHARCGTDGRWILGCAFASPLSEQELQDLLGSISLTAAGKFSRPVQRAPLDQ